MDELKEDKSFDFDELYKNPNTVDGTVHFMDYFDHALYLRFALHENELFFRRRWSEVRHEKSNYTGLGILFTLIFLTSNIIENLVKARSLYNLKKENLLKTYPTLKMVKDNYWKCNGHEILRIANNSGIQLEEGELELLKTLEPFFVWGGRYPHPFKRDDYVRINKGNNKEYYSTKTPKIIDGMFKRFAEEMMIKERLILT
jgi:hypothetical protein